MDWFISLFNGNELLIPLAIVAVAILISIVVAGFFDGNMYVGIWTVVIICISTFPTIMGGYYNGFLSSYKLALYEHYDEYEEYIKKVDDIPAEDVGGIYPYTLKPYIAERIKRKTEDSSFIKLITVNKDDKTSEIILWDQCAEYKEVTDDSVEESYYQFYKDDVKKIVILEKHIGTNERNEEPDEEPKKPKRIPQG